MSQAPDEALSSRGWFTWQRMSQLALGASLGVLLVRYFFVANASLSYDEATYVELASHPWRSNFYPDQVFVRHPPLYFLVLSAWSALFGTAEWTARLPSLLFSGAAVTLAWHALRQRAGDKAAALGALFLASNALTLVYGLQATMYPLAFFLATLGTWAHARRDDRLEAAAIGMLALTHLFGFVFAAAWLWQRRPTLHQARVLVPAAAWLGLASLVGVWNLVSRSNPDVNTLGPLWQVLRAGNVVADAYGHLEFLLLHALVFGIALLLLNPLMLRHGWRARRQWGPWALAGAVLVMLLLPGPAFLRYALLLSPVVLLAGLPEFMRQRNLRIPVALFVAFAAAGSVAATAYLASDLDPRVTNDQPGRIDWEQAAQHVADHPAEQVIAPAPTALAYYLARDHNLTVRDATGGPDRLQLVGDDGRDLQISLLRQPEAAPVQPAPRTLVLVPSQWEDTLVQLEEAGYRVCGDVPGLLIVRAPGPDAASCNQAWPDPDRAA